MYRKINKEYKDKILNIEFNNETFKMKFYSNISFHDLKKKCEEQFKLKEEQIKKDIKFYIILEDKSLMEIVEDTIFKMVVYQTKTCNIILKMEKKEEEKKEEEKKKEEKKEEEKKEEEKKEKGIEKEKNEKENENIINRKQENYKNKNEEIIIDKEKKYIDLEKQYNDLNEKYQELEKKLDNFIQATNKKDKEMLNAINSKDNEIKELKDKQTYNQNQILKLYKLIDPIIQNKQQNLNNEKTKNNNYPTENNKEINRFQNLTPNENTKENNSFQNYTPHGNNKEINNYQNLTPHENLKDNKNYQNITPNEKGNKYNTDLIKENTLKIQTPTNPGIFCEMIFDEDNIPMILSSQIYKIITFKLEIKNIYNNDTPRNCKIIIKDEYKDCNIKIENPNLNIIPKDKSINLDLKLKFIDYKKVKNKENYFELAIHTEIYGLISKWKKSYIYLKDDSQNIEIK